MLFDDTPQEAKRKLTQGQSKIGTEDKQRGLSSAFKINLQIFKKTASRVSWRSVRYQHFDLNCGTGYNDEAGCIGSPLAFVEMANVMGVNQFNALFCDRDQESLKTLMSNEVVIGGASSSSQTPAWFPPVEWVLDIINQCRAAGVKVYLKSNLFGTSDTHRAVNARILELPFDAPVTQDQSMVLPESLKYLGK